MGLVDFLFFTFFYGIILNEKPVIKIIKYKIELYCLIW